MVLCSDSVEFSGHPLVRASHRSTIEVTRSPNLTLDGDCVIGVRASKGLPDLSPAVREALRRDGAQVTLTIEVDSERFTLHALGSSALTLANPDEIVIRKSDFASERTLAVGADAAAKDLPIGMVQSLRRHGARGVLRIEVLI